MIQLSGPWQAALRMGKWLGAPVCERGHSSMWRGDGDSQHDIDVISHLGYVRDFFFWDFFFWDLKFFSSIFSRRSRWYWFTTCWHAAVGDTESNYLVFNKCNMLRFVDVPLMNDIQIAVSCALIEWTQLNLTNHTKTCWAAPLIFDPS